MRPARLVVVVGTATEVGKTWVTATLARSTDRRVAARKPVQSYDHPPTDADVLAAATGDDPELVCPRSYPDAVAPPMAAERLGLPVPKLDELVDELSWRDGVEVGFVETAGGVRSPMADDGDAVDLARRLAPDLVLLVADAGLGTINAVRTSVAQLDGLPVVVWLNRYDPGDDLHQRNRQWLAERDGLDVVTEAEEFWARLRAR